VTVLRSISEDHLVLGSFGWLFLISRDYEEIASEVFGKPVRGLKRLFGLAPKPDYVLLQSKCLANRQMAIAMFAQLDALKKGYDGVPAEFGLLTEAFKTAMQGGVHLEALVCHYGKLPIDQPKSAAAELVYFQRCEAAIGRFVPYLFHLRSQMESDPTSVVDACQESLQYMPDGFSTENLPKPPT
jgi:hypothetical protein